MKKLILSIALIATTSTQAMDNTSHNKTMIQSSKLPKEHTQQPAPAYLVSYAKKIASLSTKELREEFFSMRTHMLLLNHIKQQTEQYNDVWQANLLKPELEMALAKWQLLHRTIVKRKIVIEDPEACK